MESNLPPDVAAQHLIALLKDPAFGNLHRLANEHPLPRAEFDTMLMPRGLSNDLTWELLSTLRRQTAIDLPFRDGEGRRGWFSPTRSIQADLDDINRRCSRGSWLDMAITSRNITYFLVEAHINEAISTLQEDGLDIGYEKAREVLLDERKPETLEETLLLNEHRAIWHLDEYLDEPCTADLLLHLYEEVARDVGEQTTPSALQESRLWKRKRLDTTSTLALAAKLINQSNAPDTEHPLLLALGLRHLLMSTLPLPSWNGVVSSLAMKLLFKKAHLPVLCFVPITRACRDWARGILRPPTVMATLEDAEVLAGDEVDYTIYVGVMTRLVRQRLDEVEAELRRVLEFDELFSRTLREDLDINHRQRRVLQVALNNPDAVFKIESHQKTHRVAYATARADLMKLAELGFLQCIRGKRAFEFPVAPGLRKRLMGQSRTAKPR